MAIEPPCLAIASQWQILLAVAKSLTLYRRRRLANETLQYTQEIASLTDQLIRILSRANPATSMSQAGLPHPHLQHSSRVIDNDGVKQGRPVPGADRLLLPRVVADQSSSHGVSPYPAVHRVYQELFS